MLKLKQLDRRKVQMGITHVIRGDDHLNNAARQMLIYKAMEWTLPIYAHIPLIFDSGS